MEIKQTFEREGYLYLEGTIYRQGEGYVEYIKKIKLADISHIESEVGPKGGLHNWKIIAKGEEEEWKRTMWQGGGGRSGYEIIEEFTKRGIENKETLDPY